MAQLEKISADCNYTGYIEKYATYPPTTAVFPFPENSPNTSDYCDIWDLIAEAATIINPAFNIYHIFDMYPILWNVLGFPWVQSRNYRFQLLFIILIAVNKSHHSTSTELTSNRRFMRLWMRTGWNVQISTFSLTETQVYHPHWPYYQASSRRITGLSSSMDWQTLSLLQKGSFIPSLDGLHF